MYYKELEIVHHLYNALMTDMEIIKLQKKLINSVCNVVYDAFFFPLSTPLCQ